MAMYGRPAKQGRRILLALQEVKAQCLCSPDDRDRCANGVDIDTEDFGDEQIDEVDTETLALSQKLNKKLLSRKMHPEPLIDGVRGIATDMVDEDPVRTSVNHFIFVSVQVSLQITG